MLASPAACGLGCLNSDSLGGRNCVTAAAPFDRSAEALKAAKPPRNAAPNGPAQAQPGGGPGRTGPFKQARHATGLRRSSGRQRLAQELKPLQDQRKQLISERDRPQRRIASRDQDIRRKRKQNSPGSGQADQRRRKAESVAGGEPDRLQARGRGDQQRPALATVKGPPSSGERGPSP